MQVATLICTDASGKTYAARLEPSQLEEFQPAKSFVGPFRFEFSMDDANGSHDFECDLILNENGFMASFENFPILGRFDEVLMPSWVEETFLDLFEGPPVQIANLQIDKVYADCKSIVIRHENGKSPMVFVVDKDGQTRSIIFYNFYEDTRICLGGVRLPSEPMMALQNIIASVTKPHATFSRDLRFRKKGNQIIEQNGGKVNLEKIDLPEVKSELELLLKTKPIAKIRP